MLGIPTDRIHISETNTANVPNTSPTAASSGSDLNGMAVLVRNRDTSPVFMRSSNMGGSMIS